MTAEKIGGTIVINKYRGQSTDEYVSRYVASQQPE